MSDTYVEIDEQILIDIANTLRDYQPISGKYDDFQKYFFEITGKYSEELVDHEIFSDYAGKLKIRLDRKDYPRNLNEQILKFITPGGSSDGEIFVTPPTIGEFVKSMFLNKKNLDVASVSRVDDNYSISGEEEKYILKFPGLTCLHDINPFNNLDLSNIYAIYLDDVTYVGQQTFFNCTWSYPAISLTHPGVVISAYTAFNGSVFIGEGASIEPFTASDGTTQYLPTGDYTLIPHKNDRDKILSDQEYASTFCNGYFEGISESYLQYWE